MKYIVFSFIAFALFIGTLVVVCVRQDIPLVSVNYYEEDLRYDHKLAQKKMRRRWPNFLWLRWKANG